MTDILIVDDEPKVAFFLGIALERSDEDYRVTIVHSGEEALDVLGCTSVDLLVTDLRMPGISGLELIRWARVHRPQTRIILITAFGSEETKAEARLLGVNGYITKPFDIERFADTVRGVLDVPSLQAEGGPGEGLVSTVGAEDRQAG